MSILNRYEQANNNHKCRCVGRSCIDLPGRRNFEEAS